MGTYVSTFFLSIPKQEGSPFLSSLLLILLLTAFSRRWVSWEYLDIPANIPVEIMLLKRHLPWSFQEPFEEQLLEDKLDVLSCHHHSFPSPSAWHLEKFIRKDYGACRIKTQMTSLKGGWMQWCVSSDSFYWNCLVFLFVIFLKRLEGEGNQNSTHDYNRPGLKCAMWFLAWVGPESCGYPTAELTSRCPCGKM